MYISTPLHEEAIIHYLVFLVEVYNSASYMGGICFLEIDSVSKYCLSLAQLSPNLKKNKKIRGQKGFIWHNLANYQLFQARKAPSEARQTLATGPNPSLVVTLGLVIIISFIVSYVTG